MTKQFVLEICPSIYVKNLYFLKLIRRFEFTKVCCNSRCYILYYVTRRPVEKYVRSDICLHPEYNNFAFYCLKNYETSINNVSGIIMP